MSRSDAPDKDGGEWKAKETIHIPAVPVDADRLPPLLQGFSAVPPVVTDIDLSLDDRFLYVACWGTGELRQYDVSDPFTPRLAGTVELGGLFHGADHPSGRRWAGGPQMIEVSRDGRRVYGTNSLYGAWDPQFYPHGVPGAMFKRCRHRRRRTGARPGFPRRVSRPPRSPDPPRGRRLLHRLVLLRLSRGSRGPSRRPRAAHAKFAGADLGRAGRTCTSLFLSTRPTSCSGSRQT